MKEKYPDPVQITSTDIHYGWPTRVDTASQMTKDYKEAVEGHDSTLAPVTVISKELG